MKTALWITDMGAGDVATMLAHAKAARASIVCIRSTSTALPAAIAAFAAAKIEVYGWRWPAVRKPGPGGAAHYYALDEAAYVVGTLLPKGLKGYIVDAESDHPDDINDWNSTAHTSLAEQFCGAIRQGAQAHGIKDFHFGVTSGCQYPTNFAHIPWKTFVAAADALYPQTYWRALGKTGCAPIKGADTPASAYAHGIASWKTIAAGKPIVAVAGEIDCLAPHLDEITQFGKLIAGKQPVDRKSVV